MNIFGGNTGMSYEDLQRKRAVADRLVQANTQTPRNVGEGLSAIGRALAARAIERRTSRREGELKAEADDLWKGVFGDIGGQSSGPQTYAAPAPAVSTTNIEGKAVADDTMRALGKEPIGMPAEVRAGVFAGESGGDYDAVFGYQQRPGGQFEGVKPSEMRVAEVLQFQDPSGPYGQYVKGQVGRVATPVGAYQVVGTTLREAVKAGVVSPDEKFTPEVQDRVGDWVYKTQGTGAWEGYRGPGGGGQGGGQGGVAPRQIASTQAIAEALSNPYIQKDPGKVAILQALLQQQLAPPPTMTPYQQAQIDLRKRELEMDSAGGGSTEYGLTPQFITTPEGDLQMIQLSKDGTAKVVDLPEGAAIQKGVEKLDLGTNYQWYNTITGEPIGQPIPKDLRGAEAEKAAGATEGRAEAEGRIAAPENLAKAQEMKTLIDSVLNDPALDSIVGNVQGRLPAGIPGITGGQAGTDVSVKIRQIGGKAFLEAFETLKGGGQITEREGQAAKDAIARLERAQSEPEYRAALRELQAISDRAILRAQGKLGTEPETEAVGKPTHRFNLETGEIEVVQ